MKALLRNLKLSYQNEALGVAMTPSEGGDYEGLRNQPAPRLVLSGGYICVLCYDPFAWLDEEEKSKGRYYISGDHNDHEQYVLAARLELLWEMPIDGFENNTAEEKLEELKAGAAEAKVIKEEVEELGFIDGEQVFEGEIMELENLMREFSELSIHCCQGGGLATAQPPPEAPSKVGNETIAKFKERLEEISEYLDKAEVDAKVPVEGHHEDKPTALLCRNGTMAFSVHPTTHVSLRITGLYLT